MTPRRIRRLGVHVVVAFICGSLAAPLAGILPAGASAVGDKKSQASRIAQQIRAEGLRVQQLAEALNQARLATDALQAKIAATEVQIAQTDAKAAKDRVALRAEAVTMFVTGGRAATLQAISHGRPSDIVITQAYLSRAFANQQDALDQMRSVGRQLRDQRAALATERRQAADAQSRVDADQRAAAAAEVATLGTLSRVQGELAVLVTAEQQRLAAQEAATIQAELTARLASAAASRSRPTPPGGGLPGIGVAPSGPIPAPNAGASAAIAAAQAQLGKPYLYGGAGPGSFDCSGLTRWAWLAGGVSLSHGATAQYFATAHVPLSAAQPGDLVFYGSGRYMYHEGLYVGGGQMIEAEHSGTVVHYASIYRSGLYPLVGRV